MNTMIVCFVVLAVAAGAISAANLTVPSATDEYVALWDRKYQTDINAANLKVECLDARAADAIRIIKDQQEETLKEMKRFEDSLVPAEALSVVRKHCSQKYKGMLVTQEAISTKYQSCIAVAQSRVNSITTTAKTAVSSAKTSANVNLPRALVNCNTTYYNNPPKKEECIVSNINTYTSSIDENMKAVDKNLDASLCTSIDFSRDAVQCSFRAESNVLMTIGKVSTLIDNCIKETETVCPCAKNLMVEAATPVSARSLLMGTATAAVTGQRNATSS